MTAVRLISRARWVGFVTTTLAGLLVGGAWWVLPAGPAARGSVVAFLLAAAVGEMVVLDDPHRRPVPASIAVMCAFVLLGNGPLTTLVVAGGGYLLGWAMIRTVATPTFRFPDLLGRLIGAWSLPTMVVLAQLAVPDLVLEAKAAPDEPLHVVAFAVVSLAIVLGLPFWDAVEQGSPLGSVIGPLYARRLRTTWLAGVAIAAGAGLAALVHADLGAWALVLTMLPLLAARSGLRRLGMVRRTHDETVRAMSRLPEFVQAAPEGHAERVTRMVVSMGRDLGLTSSELETLERAALLHEIGAVVAEGDEYRAAHASAAVVREVPHLGEVAAIIDRYRDPPGMAVRLGEQRTPLPARILRTACEFDRSIAATALEPDSYDALRHFHVTSGHQHEPALIQALARTVDRSLLI